MVPLLRRIAAQESRTFYHEFLSLHQHTQHLLLTLVESLVCTIETSLHRSVHFSHHHHPIHPSLTRARLSAAYTLIKCIRLGSLKRFLIEEADIVREAVPGQYAGVMEFLDLPPRKNGVTVVRPRDSGDVRITVVEVVTGMDLRDLGAGWGRRLRDVGRWL